jgi:hypothetical protein
MDANLPHPLCTRLDRDWIDLLRSNETDLQVELNDLNDEIATRIARVGTVLAELRVTRATLADLAGRAA